MSSKSKTGAKKAGGKKAKTGSKSSEGGSKRVAQPVWTQAKADAARKNGTYIKLGDKRGSLSLSGAPAMWKKDSTFVYLPNLRVAGRSSDVQRILGELGLIEPDIRAELATAYRAGSETSAAFLAEVEALKASRAKGKSGGGKAKVASLPHSISFYADAVDAATIESKNGEKAAKKGAKKSKSKSPAKKAKKAGAKKAGSKSKSKSASPRGRKAGTKSKSKSKSKSASPKKRGSPKGKRGAKPLADKIANLADGKVMDVSKFLVDGSGAKVVAQPGGKSKKVLVPGTRLVSDSLSGIKKAAKALGDESLVQRWQDAKAGHEGGAEASPSRSRSPSPARTHEMSPRPLSPGGLPPLPRASSPRSSGSGVSLPKIPTTLGSPRS